MKEIFGIATDGEYLVCFSKKLQAVYLIVLNDNLTFTHFFPFLKRIIRFAVYLLLHSVCNLSHSFMKAFTGMQEMGAMKFFVIVTFLT